MVNIEIQALFIRWQLISNNDFEIKISFSKELGKKKV